MKKIVVLSPDRGMGVIVEGVFQYLSDAERMFDKNKFEFVEADYHHDCDCFGYGSESEKPFCSSCGGLTKYGKRMYE